MQEHAPDGRERSLREHGRRWVALPLGRPRRGARGPSVSSAVGLAAAALGSLGFLLSGFDNSPDGSNNQAGRNAAIGLMVGGWAAAGGGVALIVLNASAKVSQTGNPPAGISDPPPRPITWRGDRPEQRQARSMMGVQIVQGVF